MEQRNPEPLTRLVDPGSRIDGREASVASLHQCSGGKLSIGWPKGIDRGETARESDLENCAIVACPKAIRAAGRCRPIEVAVSGLD